MWPSRSAPCWPLRASGQQFFGREPGARQVPAREALKLPSALLRTSVFVDTSAFYALADRTDRLHSSAVRFVETNERLLVTSSFVVHETVTLIRMRLGHAAAVAFGRRLLREDIAPVIPITTRDEL